MDMNLKAFMKEELKNLGTMEFPGIEKFKDKEGKPVPFVVKISKRLEICIIQQRFIVIKRMAIVP